MAIETVNGVANYYGPRNRYEALDGQNKTEGSLKELVILFDGDSRSKVAGTLPAGARVTDTTVEVVTAGTMTGTTPVIDVGTSGSAGTNRGIQLSQANAQAAGVYAGTAAGTWAAPLAAATTVAVELGGGSPTLAGGAYKVVIRYLTL